MSRAQSILKTIEEKGLLKAIAKGAVIGAGGALVYHVGKKVLGKSDKLEHPSARRRRRGDYDY